MKAIDVLPPILLVTTSGSPLLGPGPGPQHPGKPIQVTQLEFMLMVAGEAPFLTGKAGRTAARFQASAIAAIKIAFGKDGNGELRDDVHEAALLAIDKMTIGINHFGAQRGTEVAWCFLPFFDAVASAKTVPAPNQ